MTKLDRRQKTSLDEAYRYYHKLNQHYIAPELYCLVRCLKTVSNALSFCGDGQFKLTRQLWGRVYQSLFDVLITAFPGSFLITDGQGHPVKDSFSEKEVVEFRADGCRRADDLFCLPIKQLFPATYLHLSRIWKKGGTRVQPADFPALECDDSSCFLRPVELGSEILNQESQSGKTKAYQQWWDLYWQTYCLRDRQEIVRIEGQMLKLESVWGSLYY